jgi:hypothetical protein
MSHHHALRRDLAKLRCRIEALQAAQGVQPAASSPETDARGAATVDRTAADEAPTVEMTGAVNVPICDNCA